MTMMGPLFLQRCHPRLCHHPCSQRLPEVRRSQSVVTPAMEIVSTPRSLGPWCLFPSRLNATHMSAIRFDWVGNPKQTFEGRKGAFLVSTPGGSWCRNCARARFKWGTTLPSQGAEEGDLHLVFKALNMEIRDWRRVHRCRCWSSIRAHLIQVPRDRLLCETDSRESALESVSSKCAIFLASACRRSSAAPIRAQS